MRKNEQRNTNTMKSFVGGGGGGGGGGVTLQCGDVREHRMNQSINQSAEESSVINQSSLFGSVFFCCLFVRRESRSVCWPRLNRKQTFNDRWK
jgi:hypothetical protein